MLDISNAPCFHGTKIKFKQSKNFPLGMRKEKASPGEVTAIRLPSIFEVIFIRSAIFLAIEAASDEGTTRRIIKRVKGIIKNPTSLKEVTAAHFVFLHYFMTCIIAMDISMNQDYD